MVSHAPTTPKIANWRDEFPSDGPSGDSPASSIERYLTLRFFELIRRADRLASYALHGVLDKDADGKGSRRDPVASDILSLKPHLDAIGLQFTSLQHWRTVTGYTPEEADIEDVDLDALAFELCRRNQEDWLGAEARTPKGKQVRRMPPEGPTAEFPLAQKRTWFLKLHGQTNALSEELSQKAGDIERKLVAAEADPDCVKEDVANLAAASVFQRRLIPMAHQALKHRETIIVAWAHLVGAIFDTKDKRQQQAIDLLRNMVTSRQRLSRAKNWRKVRIGTLQWAVREMKAARQGDYLAYRRVNGFTESAKGSRWVPLFLGDAHRDMIDNLMADLRCKECGKFHLGDQVPVPHETSGMEYVPPVTCPHCGAKDCAGQRNHRLAACRGIGKSTEGRLTFAFRIALYIRREYVPEGMIITGTIDESVKRKKLIIDVMRRPAHRLIFPQAVAHAAPSERILTVLGINRAIAHCYGIKSVPPGAHVDIIHADDVVNEDNTFRKPADQYVVQRAITNVVRYSRKAWTVFDWLTTVWKIDDPDHHIEKVAEQRPDIWVNTVIAAGGPEPVYDESGNVIKEAWWSPWVEGLGDAKEMEAMHKEDAFAFQRAMMMIRVSDADCIFKREAMEFYITDTDPLLAEAPAEFLEACHFVKRDEMTRWPHVLGVDLAFTPAEKARSQHSRTACTVIAIHPHTKKQYVRWSEARSIGSADHEPYIFATWRMYPQPDIFIEAEKSVNELEDKLRDQDCVVDTYVPGKYGGKAFRKMPLATKVNNGEVLFPGRLMRDVKGDWVIEPVPWLQAEKKGLLDDLIIFPAKCGDHLDSLEVASRMGHDIYGGPPEEPEQDPEAPRDWRRVPRFRWPELEKPADDTLEAHLEAVVGVPDGNPFDYFLDKPEEVEHSSRRLGHQSREE